MKKIVLLFFICWSFMNAAIYKPKNSEEKRVLDKFKNEKIVFSAEKTTFYTNKIINDKSINDIMLDMFNNFLGLNVDLKEGNFSDEYKNALDKKTDGVLMLSKTDERGKLFEFSDSIFNENIYVASFTKDITSLNDLDKKRINIIEDSIYKEYFKSIISSNDLDIELIPIKNYKEAKEEYILTPYPLILKPKSYYRISHSPGIAVALNKEYKELVPLINNALNLKYRELINIHIDKMLKKYAEESFKNSLTQEELEKFKNLKNLTVLVEKNESISYFEKNTKLLKGTIPNILRELSQQLKVPIKIKLIQEANDTILKGLDKKSYDFIVLSKIKERQKKMIFSKKLYDINTYVVFKNNSVKNNKIGVISGGIEEYLVLRYEVERNIVKFREYKELINALNNNKIEFAITNDITNLSSEDYVIYSFENVPLNFAFNKDNLIIKNIIDKALKYAIDVPEIIRISYIEKEQNERVVLSENKKQRVILILLVLFSFLTIGILSLKYILKSKTNKKLQKDPLTGLNNRTVFNIFCKESGDEYDGNVFVIDFNNFKMINDRYGHEFGDSILAEFGKFLRMIFEENEVFRISGDEFYGVFKTRLDKVLGQLKNYKRYCPNLEKYDISFNIGIYRKEAGESIETAFKYADLAMLDNKKNKVYAYKIADREFIKKKHREQEIVKILDGDMKEIYGVFQPKMEIKTERIIGVEALARCRSEELGYIYPNEFIPIAETFNKIHKIDFRILEESCKNIKKWRENGVISDNFVVSFNLSVKTFTQKNLIDKIKTIMKEYGIEGKNLEVEITESIFINNMNEIVQKLNALIALGIRISLDDFTAGHATAGILPLLPIKTVKFDKSLIDSLGENEEKGKIIYLKLVSLIKELNLKIVAEGVETLKEFDFLKELSVDCVQGYLVGKPERYENFNIKLKRD